MLLRNQGEPPLTIFSEKIVRSGHGSIRRIWDLAAGALSPEFLGPLFWGMPSNRAHVLGSTGTGVFAGARFEITTGIKRGTFLFLLSRPLCPRGMEKYRQTPSSKVYRKIGKPLCPRGIKKYRTTAPWSCGGFALACFA